MKAIKNLFKVIVALVLIGGWALAASALHVVWTGSKPVIFSKDSLGVRDTYVDVSKWTVDDVSNHPIVCARLVETGRAEVLAHVFKDAKPEQLVQQISDAVARGPTTKPVDLMEKAQQVVQQAKAKVGQ